MFAPVALFVYKRPDHTQRTLDALARNSLAHETNLIIFCDGPKGEGDTAGVSDVRKVVRGASGFASVTRVERPANMGLARSVIAGATELLEKHGSVIVLEDDLVTSPNFLAFMNKALDHYRDDPKAFSVTGHTFPASSLEIPSDYAFDTYASYRCSSWSWGTWLDRWRRIDWDMTYFPEFSSDPFAREMFNRGGRDMSELLRLQYEGKIDSWAIRFCYAHHVNKMRCIYPRRTLVRNIGLDNSGTHSRPAPRFMHPSIDEGWMPRHFCPAGAMDERIVRNFRAVFDPPPPTRGRRLLVKAKGFVRFATQRARGIAVRLARLVIKPVQSADILLVNTSQKSGGAARAAWRTYLGIRRIRPDALYLNLFCDDRTPGIIGLPSTSLHGVLARRLVRLDQLPLHRYSGRPKAIFSPALYPNPLRIPLSRFRPRLVHLHWLAYGLLRIEELGRLRAPVVWTLHDTWAFTGGCHYTGDCDGFRKRCGCCPQLGSTRGDDLSCKVWQRKHDAYARMNLTIVAPSRWLADLARQSSLFAGRRIEVIPNGLDTDVFRPMDKAAAKAFLGIDPNHPVLLFGAQWLTDRRKGGDILAAALERLEFPCTLLTFGAGAAALDVNPNVTVYGLGSLADDISLAVVYSAADMFICPSREDNLPNTVAEAMACGTPCVAFDVNGLPEMVEHMVNGWLARPCDPVDLAAGIRWLVGHPCPDELRQNARQHALAEYSLDIMGSRYETLYEDLLNG
ncbi:glycosyltransferase [Nitratidesulfovibrio sp. D1]|uniref:glycosyltransferase n=1 Tax=Nitratidesulfovibrio sp. D1 TaxID=3440151 RepID=UPI003EB8055B